MITEGQYSFTLYQGEFVNGFRQGIGKAPIFVLSSHHNGSTFVGNYKYVTQR